MKVSLVLATVGRTDDLEVFFGSASAQTYRDFEILIVDQNADDRVEPLVARAAATGLAVQHIRLSPPNLSSARNLGLQHAAGDLVGFPDDDCWYEPNTLAELSAAFDAHPDWQGVVAHWVEQCPGPTGKFVDGALLQLDAWRRFRGGAASSISLFLRRELLQALGGFDVRLGVGQFYGAAEETDLVLRALAGGAAIGRCVEAKVHHRFALRTLTQAPGGLPGLVRRARGTGALYAKHALPGWVVLRGLFAPPLRAVLGGKGLREAGFAIAQTWGRAHGMFRWHLQAWRGREQ